MAGIVQRWEWRTFGESFGRAEAAFAELSSTGVQESDEVYLLSAAGDSVKVRADLLDIKALREVNDDGLERWEPILKAAFPLSLENLQAVKVSLGLAPAGSDRSGMTLDEFLDEVIRPSDTVRPTSVHKRRVRYVVDGCTSEVTDVTADGHATRTIAIESEDAAAVIGAVRRVGLEGYINTSYPRGLARLLDDAKARYAVIDVGTNSIKFHVGQRGADGAWLRVVDRAEVTRLGEGLEASGEIVAEALDRTSAAIAGMVDEAKRDDAVAIAAVGTAGLRAAGNSGSVISTIAARTGVRIEVIPGEEEGRLAYLAVQDALGLGDGSIVVFDTGGGSSQFTFGHGTEVDERFSVPVGAVRYTERFGLAGAVDRAVLEEAEAAIGADLARIDGRPRPDALTGMGGALTNLAAVKHGLARYDPDVVQGTVLDRDEIDRQIELFRSRDAAGRREIVGLQPKRADVILAGACIVSTVMRKLGHDSLVVSDRGLRHG
ncbi:MAG: Ppx/GppA family phosphatase, partial [Chloroflexota bacterium]